MSAGYLWPDGKFFMRYRPTDESNALRADEALKLVKFFLKDFMMDIGVLIFVWEVKGNHLRYLGLLQRRFYKILIHQRQ